MNHNRICVSDRLQWIFVGISCHLVLHLAIEYVQIVWYFTLWINGDCYKKALSCLDLQVFTSLLGNFIVDLALSGGQL